MKYLDPGEHVLFPVMISVRADAAELLREMAREMGTTMDELISALAEDSACDLVPLKDCLDDVVIPDKCSTNDLLEKINSKTKLIAITHMSNVTGSIIDFEEIKKKNSKCKNIFWKYQNTNN